MGVLSNIFKARDKPENRTAGSAYTFYMGGTTSGKAVTERSSMQMTAVYFCVRILAEAVAGLPLHLYKYNDDGSNGNMLPLKDAGAFANTTDNDEKEENPDEEVLEVEEPGTDGSANPCSLFQLAGGNRKVEPP